MAVSFDRVAGIYDSTRWSGVPAEIMQKLLTSMKKTLADCRTLLDLGTGTGFFAQYFQNSGFSVVGVDVSLSMMAKAREKGVRDLVRADAHNLPFKDGSFDATVLIHLLQLVKDWVQVVHEVGRVTKTVAVSEIGEADGFRPRQEYLQLRRDLGYPLNRFNDAELGLSKIVAPRTRNVIGDYWTDVIADEAISNLEKGGFAISWDLPDKIHGAIIERLRTCYQGRVLRRRDWLEVAGWDPFALRTLRV